MFDFWKNTLIQESLVVVTVVAVMFACVLTCTASVFVAMLGGVIASMLFGVFYYRNRWKMLEGEGYVIYKSYLWVFIMGLVGSQMAWLALLV